MLHSNAILNGNVNKLLNYNQDEHPLAIQLGGSDPRSLAEASVISEEFGFKEINLNVGCPSSKVQKGRFGAVLMKEPGLVSECINEMKKSVNIPVTVKCRIGIDDMDEDAHLDRFIKEVSFSGCKTFIVHARKAWPCLSCMNYKRLASRETDFFYKSVQMSVLVHIVNTNSTFDCHRYINRFLHFIDALGN